MSRFAAIKAEKAKPEPKADQAASPSSDRAAARSGKKVISGFFSPDMSRALHVLALERDSSLQAIMGEAFDDLLRKYGRHPFGER